MEKVHTIHTRATRVAHPPLTIHSVHQSTLMPLGIGYYAFLLPKSSEKKKRKKVKADLGFLFSSARNFEVKGEESKGGIPP